MMEIYVCVGSSCHLKGSYDIIQLAKERLAKDKLTDKVEFKATFCLGKCTNGVSMKIDGEIVTGVSKENFDVIYDKYIASKLK
ncbi:MAG: (2Fe-2S) ferredoxin domain-containing protein [Bacteroidia bacterium]|nr:(2Fe-2S) ferredoxin domain-containing protein [Bacteroidia bacterium]